MYSLRRQRHPASAYTKLCSSGARPLPQTPHSRTSRSIESNRKYRVYSIRSQRDNSGCIVKAETPSFGLHKTFLQSSQALAPDATKYNNTNGSPCSVLYLMFNGLCVVSYKCPLMYKHHFVDRTLWPSGLRHWLKAPVRKGVSSNPTGVMKAELIFQLCCMSPVCCP